LHLAHIGVVAAAIAALAALEATAQPPVPPTVPTIADTVRVTRDRLPSDLLKAPLATTEIKADALVTGRQIGLDEGLNLVPGALAQSRSGGQDVRITIRGFGARGAGDRSNAGTTRGIRVLLDGFPITEPDGRTSLDLADLGAMERIRVVRSNTSALFGSASGGLIELNTVGPFTDPFTEARTSFGSFGLQRLHARGGLLLGSGQLRMSLSDTRFDGWREQSASETTTLQASIVSHLGANTSLDVVLSGTDNYTEQPGALTRAEMESNPRQANPTYVLDNSRRENLLGRVGVRLEHEISPRQDFQIAGFVEPKSLHRSERSRFRDFTRIHLGGNAHYVLDFEPRASLRARWTTGIEDAFQDGSVIFWELGPNGTRSNVQVANQREAMHNFGVYTEIDLRPSDRWIVAAGARYDLMRYISEDYLAPQLSDERDLDHISPRLSASYQFKRGHTAYAALSTGIEAPAFNEIDPPAPFDTLTTLNPFLEPATSLTLEVGAKGIKLLTDDGKNLVRYDVALYGLEVRNDIIPFDGGAYYLTAGKSRRAGIELGSEVVTAAGISSRAACTLTHNEYVEYTNDLGTFDGNESAGLPNITFDFRARYDSRWGAYLESAVHARGSYFADDANLASVAPFGTWDATLGLKRAFGRTRLDAFAGVANLLDTPYVASVFINGTNGRYYEPGMERNALFGLSVRYQ